MKLLLIYPDFNASGDNPSGKGFYSDGIAALSAYIKQEGHQVNLFHLVHSVEEDEFKSQIRNFSPDLIGISTRTSIYNYTKQFSQWSKAALPYTPLIIGGVHATLVPDEVISEPEVDAVSIGDGEFNLKEYIDWVENGCKPDLRIAGIYRKENGEILKGEARPCITPLSQLPIPDFEIFDYKSLFSPSIKTIPVMLSRGCPFMCTYCCNHQIKQVYPNINEYTRFFTPEKSIEYIKAILEKYPDMKYVDFRDNILPFNIDWFIDFSERYKKEINLPFACRYRANLVKEEVIIALKNAGCYLVHFGVETGNDHMSNVILKRAINREQLINAFDLCHKHGLSTLAYNMVGLPDEDLVKALDTIKLNSILKPERMLMAIFYPYPKTSLYEYSIQKGYIPDNLSYADEVRLSQPQFPDEEVDFISTYSKLLIRIYSIIKNFPDGLARFLEKILDKIVITKKKPHKILNKIAMSIKANINRLKSFIRTNFPRLYLKLRDFLVIKK
ncbi:MAG: B12-binding domain-containing radical SAM protein [Candidatus Coatesbacteria bacterium]|nr:B12-binding domain-containing radical SAM protein [Candidatus Coatesbacteria bacterium]